MTEIEDLLEDIDKLHRNLYEMATKKNHNLQDPEVIAASQILNAAITKYNEIVMTF